MRMPLALLLAVAFAVSPTDGFAGDKQITDVKELAGTWLGTVTADSGGARATMTIKEDGSYEASTRTGTLTVGKYSLENGKLQYRSTLSVGTATVSEERGRTFLTVMPERQDITGKTVYEKVKVKVK